MRITLALLLPLVFLACASCQGEETETDPRGGPLLLVPSFPGVELPRGQSGGTVARVEVAADPASRHRGLMERDSLQADTGMLFVYPTERPLEFWMKNTRIPLSICFIDRAGVVVRILDMEPDPGTPDHLLPRYRSGRPATYALEMERGWFRAKGVRVGDRVRFHPTLLDLRSR
ncbi:MAG: DUF192 domain-containing protein [Planctomycetota bacterium]|jgi:uncharacterized membrane protein (UPF0127 family)